MNVIREKNKREMEGGKRGRNRQTTRKVCEKAAGSERERER